MRKLSKVEANQIMEKFSKLVPTKHTAGRPPTLTWMAPDCNSSLVLTMYRYHSWTIESKKCLDRWEHTTVNTLDFNAFPLWQRIRLNFFFKNVWRDARDKKRGEEYAAKLAKSIAATEEILGRDNA